ncbi:MAG TPA: glutamate synthase subunit beta [Vicinamibacterales bacterium]|nr:glutamate synthase subunit beta [Vicinamibacterales bacterium]
MGKATGFVEFQRAKPPARPVPERVADYRHVYYAYPAEELTRQAARCMDCGIPFCHQGCPLGNLIPEWNELVYRDSWRAAIERLHRTNNFPEFTGLLCPAPCEGSCVLGISKEPVTIKSIELAIVDRAFEEGWITPLPPTVRTWKKVAVIGAGPAGLAAAAQLNRAGHSVTVFEKSDRLGGLLRYGIPEFKMEKRILDRRLELLASEGVVFRPRVNAGTDVTAEDLQRDFDAILLAGGSGKARDLDVPGRPLNGVHFAMDYLTQQNRRCQGDEVPQATSISAAGKHVVIIGGGDTGADCLGTAHRQGAVSVTQLELLPRPALERTADNPWPLWPNVFRTSPAHEEGGERLYAVVTTDFLDDGTGAVRALRGHRVERVIADGRARFDAVPDSAFEMPADLVLLAMGFVGPERGRLLDDLRVRISPRGTVWTDGRWQTSVPGVFAAGDMQRGQSLIVWAIDEGRRAAQAIDAYLIAQFT